jgi:UDP-N-acetyl-D-glucosamine dehydrogenase
MKAYQYTARFIELASEINTNMPRYVVTRILEALNERGKTLKGAQCLILGVAYKPDIDDIRESPALDVIGLLQKKGATVEYHDPYIPSLKTHEDAVMKCVPDLMAAVQAADVVVAVTNHKVYDYKAILKEARFIFDSRNALGKLGKDNPKVERL